MRVKLSYTVDEEDVLVEAAKIANLSADDLQHAISLFSEVQKELKAEDDDDSKVVNVSKCVEMIEEFRTALFNVDTRFNEVTEIIRGYDEYQRQKKQESSASLSNLQATPEPVDHRVVEEMFGAD